MDGVKTIHGCKLSHFRAEGQSRIAMETWCSSAKFGFFHDCDVLSMQASASYFKAFARIRWRVPI
jgi:hypothetical protein